MSLGPEAMDGVTLAATLAARNVIMGKNLDAKKAIALGVGQYAYDKWLKSYLESTIGSTNLASDYWVQLSANIVGLSGIIYLADSVGVLPAGADPTRAEGFVPDLNVSQSRMSGKVLNAMLESAELLLEQKVLLWGLGKTGMMPNTAPGAVTQSYA